MFADTKFVAHSMSAGLRCAGTAEFAAPDRPLRPARVAAIERVAKAALPGLQTVRATPWVGARPSLPDTLPVIGRSHLHPRVVFAFGHGHTGLTASAKTARIVADIVGGETPSIDISPFRPDRFPARRTARSA
jgi:D-amino-acid dehydrogenase